MRQQTKQRVFAIMELAAEGDVASKSFDFFMTALIGMNVLAVVLETVESIGAQYGTVLENFELVSVGIFTIEYLLRLWSCTAVKQFQEPVKGRIRYALTPMAVIDAIALVPFYLPMFFPFDLRVVRMLRFFRIFVLLKMTRYSVALRSIDDVFRAKKEELFIAIWLVFVILLIASSLMYFVESDAQPEAFGSIPAAMWWGIVTLTTVGYGDVYPVTAVGRVLGALIAVLSIDMVALPAGILASGFADQIQRRRDQKLMCPHCGRDVNEVPEVSPTRG